MISTTDCRRVTIVARVLAGLALCLTGLTSSAPASGLYTFESGPRGLSYGLAWSVHADDLMALYYNPAALTNSSGNQINLGLANIWGETTFDRQDTEYHDYESVTGDGPGRIIPHMGISTDFGSDAITIALGQWAPMSFSTEWQADGPQRFVVVESNSTMFTILTGVGLKTTPDLKLGVSFGYAHLEIDQSLVFTLDPTGQENTALESIFYVAGEDQSFHYILGGIYNITPEIAVGLTYHSPIDFALQGKSHGRLPVLGWPGEDNVTISVTFPTMVRLGVGYMTERFSSAFDLVYTRWSEVGPTKLDFENEFFSVFPQGDIDLERDYDDTFSPRLGLAYFVYPSRLQARFGLFFEPGAPPDSSASVGSSDSDKYGIVPGVAFYLFEEALRIDLMYMYLKYQDRNITDSEVEAINPLGGTPSIVGNGKLSSEANVVGMAFSYFF